MATLPTALVIDASVTAREAEVPAANFDNGMNMAASCAPGIGINMLQGAVVGTPNQFTLLDQGRPVGSGGDQIPVARDPQISQAIGGNGLGAGLEGTEPEPAIRYGTLATAAEKLADPAVDGVVTFIANSDLLVLATGWDEAAP